ncbi:MAG: hypothetical protein E7586_00165 [Ruminococcaceae bacterium]|nr:hypothetical protein [Oscillospiraceae bacterium]
MKKFLLLLMIFAMCISTIACDTTSESSSNIDSSSKTASSEPNSPKPNSSEPNSSEDFSSNNSQESSEENNNTSQSESDAIIQKTIDGISVVLNGESQLKSNGFKLDGDFSMSVSVTLEGYNSILSDITAKDITAKVDVSNLNESGTIQCVIDYTAPDGISIISRSESIANVKIKKYSAEITPPEETDIRIVNNVLISGTRAMEQFYGSATGGEKTANILNGFKEEMGDVNVYVLPAPLASAFYAPVGYEASISNHKKCFYGMRDALNNVGFVDTLSAISAHVDEEIYFRTDHHWQALAAYYACEELASVAGVSFDNISTFTTKSEDGVLGSFYTTYTKDPVLGNNPDTIVWYEPTREYTVEYYNRAGHSGDPITGRTLFSTNNGYTKFLYGDSYTTHIKTNVGNGRKLLVFKDSYGNALAPFLVGSFDEIIVADYRYFQADVSDFIAEQGITDVCFSIAAFGVSNFKGLKINY